MRATQGNDVNVTLLDFSVLAYSIMIFFFFWLLKDFIGETYVDHDFLNDQGKSLERETYYLKMQCTHFYLMIGHVTKWFMLTEWLYTTAHRQKEPDGHSDNAAGIWCWCKCSYPAGNCFCPSCSSGRTLDMVSLLLTRNANVNLSNKVTFFFFSAKHTMQWNLTSRKITKKSWRIQVK